MWSPGVRQPSGPTVASSGQHGSSRSQRWRNLGTPLAGVNSLSRRKPTILGLLPPGPVTRQTIGVSQGFLEDCLIGLAAGGRHSSDQIGDPGTKGELRAIGILEPELAVTNDPGAMQCSAGYPCARSERPVGIDDRRGAVRVDIVDDQRSTGIGVPGRIAPRPEKAAIGLRNGRWIGDPVADALLAKYSARLRFGGIRRCLSPGRGGRQYQARKRENGSASSEGPRSQPEVNGTRAYPRHVGPTGAEDIADIGAAGQVAHSDLQQPGLKFEVLANAPDPERFSV